jgi:CRISPR-associated endonuclease/helicase Cas3
MVFLKSIAKLELKNEEKYFQTLNGHTLDCLKILKAYIERNNETIAQFCERWGLNKKKFLRNLFLIVYLHDIGKLTKEFQENIKQNKRSNRYPHPYFGVFLLHKSFNNTILDVPLELAAILGHHTQLYDQLYLDNNQFEKPTFLENKIKEFISNSIKIYKHLGFDEIFEFNGFTIEIPEFSWRKIEKVRNSLIKEINIFSEENKKHELVKSVFTYIFSILQTCDDYASAHFSKFVEKYDGDERLFESVLEDPYEYVPTLNLKDPIKIIFKNKKPYDFQKDLLQPYKFVTLFAPCGRGKTEAALLWAINALKEFKRNKIVFAMPTQTTSNAMYDRLKAIFGEENVGLYHGRSFIKLKDELTNEKEEYDEEKNIEEIRSETFKGNVFFKPITITTVDHLIYSFVKGFSQADFALGNLQNAVIIFDEVHYYEKLTLEHLLTLFKLLKKMDIPHLLMSGTLPHFMLKELQDYHHIVDKEGLNFKPFKIELYAHTLSNEEIEEIVQNYKKGLTQFIILNTVERAKQFYLWLKEKLGTKANIMLYHSQFTYTDRIKKENEIYQKVNHKPFILVATQVIEISLDISCDIMFSELAPPDAIGQRAGRLNRNGKNWKNKVEHILKIYLPENNLPYEENIITKTCKVAEEYQQPVSYKDIKKLCDSVYENYNLSIPSNLINYFQKSTIFGEHWKKIATESEEGLKFKVREEKIQYIDVVPESIFLEKGKEALKVENMAKIPLYYLLEDIKNESGFFYKETNKYGKFFWICSYPYNYETGFTYFEDMKKEVYIL